ncbi:MAG: anti-sigma-factor antagonist [Candidatus Solibacter sp.]|nr:anti-sigma-factor antagonist [Candidatus Solibacter sp.]
MPTSQLARLLQNSFDQLLAEWKSSQFATVGRRLSASDENTLSANSREFLTLFRQGLETAEVQDQQAPGWAPIREFLVALSASRAKEGYTPSETASFVFSLKEPLFKLLSGEIKDPVELNREIWNLSRGLDRFGLLTMEAYQKSREEIIARQQREMLELSTPVVRIWDNILAVPLIGTLDSNRTQVIMESLLEAIVSTRSDIAIIDITGVPTVDTLVAQHLLKTVAAARLMGADCIISGVRPQIAQTIIHLGVDLSAVTTKATLAGALQVALQRTGAAIVKGHGAGR